MPINPAFSISISPILSERRQNAKILLILLILTAEAHLPERAASRKPANPKRKDFRKKARRSA
ncbi:MAG: hypothetical protein BHW65_04730 [Verrucomicrobia bacterium CAG:312_58_20]|nr:MAG: hypothetical protein BHW65_04730 [Verrucomicrobia bacterium CAG:312_58_20]